MANFVIIGLVLGALLAFAATNPSSRFRKRLVADYESHAGKGGGREFIAWIIQNRRAWMRSFAIIRKPFNNEVNLAIETAAFILSGVAMYNSLVNFERYFRSSLEGEVALVFLGAVMAFIPFQWLLSTGIDRQVHVVFEELERALLDDRIEEYMAEAKKSWM